MLRTLSRVLGRAGFACVGATTPLAALEALACRAFDAIVTDYCMHPFDGIELCQRALGAGFDGPVIIYSAHVDAALYRRAAGARVWTIVPKDAGARALAAQLATVCDHCPRALAQAPCDLAGVACAYARAHHLSERQRQLLERALLGDGREQAADAVGCAVGSVHEQWRRICESVHRPGQKEVLLDVLRFVIRALPQPLRD